LPILDFDALVQVHQHTVVDDEALILQLQAIARQYPHLLRVDLLPDYDLKPAATAVLTAEGRSLVNAYMMGQIRAYSQVRELAYDNTNTCIADLHLDAPTHPITSPNDED
jgi:hypothetical protein